MAFFGLKRQGLNINSAKDAKYIFGFSCLYTLYLITSGVEIKSSSKLGF